MSKAPSSQSIQIQVALHANLKLQSELKLRLQKIASQKKRNRLDAAKVIQQLSMVPVDDPLSDSQENEEKYARFYNEFYKELKSQHKRKSQEEQQQSKNGTSATSTPTQSLPDLPNSFTSFKKSWAYSEARRWHSRYFQDTNLSIPLPNEDTKKRRKLEGEQEYPHFSRDLKWTTIELDNLRKIVIQVVQEQQQIQPLEIKEKDAPSSHTITDSAIDFDKVAKILNEKMHKVRWSKKFNKSMHKPRTSVQCRLVYLNYASQKINKSKWTKKESLQILEMVHKEKGHPSWDHVAFSLETNRTPWQCFQHYQKTLNTRSNSSMWTLEEDELLLKYIAAQGPQFVVNNNSCEEISRRLLPDRSMKQIFIRANQTLVNPKFKFGTWDLDQERKLALCMKIYKDENNAPNQAAAHFPDRFSKRIHEKWQFNLNPVFDMNPFSEEEDALLLKTVEDLMTRMGQDGKKSSSWSPSDIKHLFPTRKPTSLFHRWCKLASDERIMEKYSCIMKQKGFVRRALVGSKTDDALFSPDDFVVRMKEE